MAWDAQSGILKYLQSLKGCWVTKISFANERGVPDVLGCYKGKFFAFEVKSGKGVATPIQKAQIDRIHVAKGVAHVVRSVDEVKNIIEGIV